MVLNCEEKVKQRKQKLYKFYFKDNKTFYKPICQVRLMWEHFSIAAFMQSSVYKITKK